MMPTNKAKLSYVIPYNHVLHVPFTKELNEYIQRAGGTVRRDFVDNVPCHTENTNQQKPVCAIQVAKIYGNGIIYGYVAYVDEDNHRVGDPITIGYITMYETNIMPVFTDENPYRILNPENPSDREQINPALQKELDNHTLQAQIKQDIEAPASLEVIQMIEQELAKDAEGKPSWFTLVPMSHEKSQDVTQEQPEAYGVYKAQDYTQYALSLKPDTIQPEQKRPLMAVCNSVLRVMMIECYTLNQEKDNEKDIIDLIGYVPTRKEIDAVFHVVQKRVSAIYVTIRQDKLQGYVLADLSLGITLDDSEPNHQENLSHVSYDLISTLFKMQRENPDILTSRITSSDIIQRAFESEYAYMSELDADTHHTDTDPKIKARREQRIKRRVTDYINRELYEPYEVTFTWLGVLHKYPELFESCLFVY